MRRLNKADVETLQKDTDDRKIQCETEINKLNQSLKEYEEKIKTEQNKNQIDAYMEEHDKLTEEKKSWEASLRNCER